MAYFVDKTGTMHREDADSCAGLAHSKTFETAQDAQDNQRGEIERSVIAKTNGRPSTIKAFCDVCLAGVSWSDLVPLPEEA